MEQYRPSGFQLLPTVVKNLIIINGILFLLMFVVSKFGIDLNNMLGLHYVASKEFKPYQIITYMFMHANFWHIFLNMFMLWMCGAAIENFWGPKRFLTYYLIAGIGAAVTQETVWWLQYRDIFLYEGVNIGGSIIPSTEFAGMLNTVGASGSVYGILLAFGIMFPNTMLYIYAIVPIKAKYFIIILIVLEIFLEFRLRGGRGDNIAHFAHLGGMLFGFIMLKIWKVKRLN
jgi:membrane associated rhomboid family serine protease